MGEEFRAGLRDLTFGVVSMVALLGAFALGTKTEASSLDCAASPLQPTAAWRMEELKQAAAVRAYASIMVSARGCGLRSNEWDYALLRAIQAEIPPGRDDLHGEFEHGKNQGFDPSLATAEQASVMCPLVDEALQDADRVVAGSQHIFEPMRYSAPR